MSTPAPPVLAQAQIDEHYRDSYWYNAVNYGLEYWNAGRYAVHGKLLIAATLLHHAVELLIKANLSRGDGVAQIKRYGYRDVYGHSLTAAWQEFKRRDGDRALDAFDNTVTELDKWEDIRYPDKLVSTGAILTIALVDPPAAAASAPGAVGSIPVYRLALPDIDRLVKLLVERSQINLKALSHLLEHEHVARYFTETNSSPLS